MSFIGDDDLFEIDPVHKDTWWYLSDKPNEIKLKPDVSYLFAFLLIEDEEERKIRSVAVLILLDLAWDNEPKSATMFTQREPRLIYSEYIKEAIEFLWEIRFIRPV